MAKRFEKLSSKDREFISKQKMFFIASSSNGDEVNLSPRGYDVFRVINDSEAIFLDYAGSGNRTARDIENNGEVTILFVSFDKEPLNLRLFCKGELIDRESDKVKTIFKNINLNGVRRFIKLKIYCIEHSCGMSVPYYEFKGERNDLREWAINQEKSNKLKDYMQKHNTPPNLNEFKKNIN